MPRFSFSALSAILLLCLCAFATPPGQKAPRSWPGSLTSTSAPEHQNASDESKVTFHSQTVLIQVPVVVVDKQGNHVRGLTKEDFQVLENGKAQAITTFEEFGSGSNPSTADTPNSDVSHNSSGTIGTTRNTSVIVFDTVNTPFLDQAYGRKQLIRYLSANVVPGQNLALVVLTSKGIRVVQPPTRDANTLLQAANRLNGELSTMEDTDISARAQAVSNSARDFPAGALAPTPSQSAYAGLRNFVLNGDDGIAQLQQDRAIEASMRGFLEISWALSGISGRKSLLWATGSFPFYLDSPGTVPAHLAVLYERTMKALNDAQISVYPIDVRGLVNTSSVAEANTRGRAGSSVARQFAARNWLQGSTIDTLREFADMTGGQAFYNTNDIAMSFRRAIADSESYYSLSYYLDTANHNPGWRNLKVEVNRKAVEIRARNGFFVTNTTVNPGLTQKLDLDFAINSPFDCTGVPVSVQWTDAPPRDSKNGGSLSVAATRTVNPEAKKIGFLLRVGGNGVSIESGTTNRFNLDFLAYAFSGNQTGAAANFAKNFEGSLLDSQLPKFREQGFGYSQAINLLPGKYTVRFVVRDNISGRIGSISAPITVN
jgi:VWFA-related protein